nr:MAG TPA: hypothetical protein [Caudoviricetes sp.]
MEPQVRILMFCSGLTPDSLESSLTQEPSAL